MDLSTLLADARAEARTLEGNGASFSVERVRAILNEIELATTEYTTWISEKEAAMRAGHSTAWIAQRFAEWERQGHARWNPETKKRQRQYRLLIIPLAHDVDSVRASARRAARKSA